MRCARFYFATQRVPRQISIRTQVKFVAVVSQCAKRSPAVCRRATEPSKPTTNSINNDCPDGLRVFYAVFIRGARPTGKRHVRSALDDHHASFVRRAKSRSLMCFLHSRTTPCVVTLSGGARQSDRWIRPHHLRRRPAVGSIVTSCARSSACACPNRDRSR